jgi:FG-GAP-like repeat
MRKWKSEHRTVLFILGAACAMTFSEVSAQSASFTMQAYPLFGNTHVAADLNGDGVLDLVGSGLNAASVMLGNADGTFRPKTDFPVGRQTQDVATGDFNRDGKIDIVITLNDPQFSFALLNGTGTGSFSAPVYFPNTSGFDSPAVLAADLDNDSKLDLVILHSIACFTAPCQSARSVTVLLGNGDGTFQPAREVDVNVFPHVMAIGDFNRDGIKDLAVGGENTELSILVGIGGGNFVRQPVITIVTGGDLFSACNDVDVGDFNRDGIPDLVVPLGNGRGTAILLGNGNGTFRVATRLLQDAVSAPQNIAVADYNRDGLLDLARAMGDGTRGLFQIMNGNGDGTFRAPVNYDVPPPNASVGGGTIISTDFNTDTKPDIALQVRGANPALHILLNTTGAPPPTLGVASLSLNPTTVTGGNSSTGTVTLTAVAQASTTVTIASNNPAAVVPASVIVPAGSQSTSFSISTTQVPATTSAVITASLNVTSRSATLTINPTGTDTVSITRAEYDGGQRRLRVEATSTRATAILQVFVTSSGQLIGTLSNEGGGRFRGEFSWPVNPQSITVRSNFGGQATRAVTLR